MPRRVGKVGAALGFCLSFVIEYVGFSHSRSSTAAIGYLFLPLFSALMAIPGFVIGWCVGYFYGWRRSRIARRRGSAFAAALVPLAVAAWMATALWEGDQLAGEVYRIRTMNGVELEAVLNQPRFAGNKFILGAIAGNRNATSSALHRIAASNVPELYKPMGSYFDVMGSNTRGLAVMRLIASNPNTAPADLERLAEARSKDVGGEVAANPAASEATLRRLADEGHYLAEWGLSYNPHAPKDILAKLATSADEFTRLGVAANPNTSVEVLAALSADPACLVRGRVAGNPATPRGVVELLLRDSDARVRGAAKANTN